MNVNQAKHAENAGFDIVLVGDSLGMVVVSVCTVFVCNT